MSVKRKPKKTSRKDKRKLAKAVENLVTDILLGQKDEIVIPIKLKINKSLYLTYKAIADEYKLPLEEVLEKLAALGINEALTKGMNPSEALKSQEGINMIEIAKSAGFSSIGDITKELDHISELATQLQNMEKALGTDNNPPK